MDMTKERPILFSGAMVRAILNGSKTQTRRVVKPQPANDPAIHHPIEPYRTSGGDWNWVLAATGMGTGDPFPCPYGKPGDLLWVREEHYRFGHWEPVPGVSTKGGRQKWRFVADADETLFDAPDEYRKGRHHKDPSTPAWHKRLARFMPRSVSRITLEITDVRVERLNDINEQDAEAEGIDFMREIPDADETLRASKLFEVLWESINGIGSWSLNPWVWVIEFRRVEQ